MFAQFNVALTKADYASGLAVVNQELGRRDPFRDRRIWEQLGAGVLLLAVLLFIFRDAGLAVFVTVLAEAFVISALGSRWTRQSFGVSYDPATAHFTAEFTEKGITEQNPDRTRDWKWAAVRHVHDTGSVLVLELDGWDMLILPYRLWADDLARSAFLREARGHVPPRATPTDASTALSPQARDQLQVGAIAVGIDLLFAITFLIQPADDGGGIPLVVFQFLIGAGVAYFAYRLARYYLPQVHAVYPRITVIVSNALVFAVPLYMAAAYLGWI